MKRVLLAINGNTPSSSIFRYAVDLCSRMKADLDIIQFLRENKVLDRISSTKKKIGAINRFMEDSFAGVAFAEQNFHTTGCEIASGISAPLKHLILEKKPDVLKHIALSEGELEKELSNYIEDHNDIVLAIFDPSSEKQKQRLKNRLKIKLLRKKFCVPLVVVNN